MGGRQSSQNNSSVRAPASRSAQSPSRLSVSSLDATNNSRSHALNMNNGVLIRGRLPTDVSGTSPIERVQRRRRRRDRNDHFIEAHSLPAHLFPTFLTADVTCPVCQKRIGSDQIETHLFACLSKPRISYNEDVLSADAGECIICFDDLNAGDRIARLPCLCIYHKKCIDEWFQRNRCCPEHPDQIPQEYSEQSSSKSSSDSTLTPSSSSSSSDTTNEQSSPEAEEDMSHSDAPTSSSFLRDVLSEAAPDSIVPVPDLTSENTTSGDSSREDMTLDLSDGLLTDDPDIAQLASKIRTILVAESPRLIDEDSNSMPELSET